MATTLEVLDGSVSSIVFHNEDNGYTIMKLEMGKEEITVVGSMPGVTPGELLSIKGEWTTHPTYGRQFKAQLTERKLPQGTQEILRYLSAGTISGVGKSTAKQLVATFGEDVLDIMEKEHEKLTEIKGISPKRAVKIHESYCKQIGTRRLLTFLTTHDLPVTLAPPLAKFYGDMALTVVENNPYLLIEEDFGLDFARADRLALELGGAADAPKRLEAGILCQLHQNLGNGHSFLPKDKLIMATAQLLQCGSGDVTIALAGLEDRGDLMFETLEQEEAVYLPSLYEAEQNVAERMVEMSHSELKPPKKLAKFIEKIQKDQDITYSPMQCQAVEFAAKHQVMLLTGGPGTGKTTSLKGVLALFEELQLETALAAPTGRAAQRLGELCQGEASTIHRLLETGVDPNTGKLVFQRNEDEPISADAVIVDETSMVDIMLMSGLISALPNHCRLILVGDPDQLPSVGPGNLFSDLISSGTIPLVRLTQIFRQAQESNIVGNAHKINRGELPDLSQTQGDFFFLQRPSPQETLETVVDLCRRRLPERMGIPSEQIQVLSPTRRRGTGTVALNKALQEALNPSSPEKNERQFGDWMFREGDRVMQVKNNYDITWRDQTANSSGMGVFNGDIGRIHEITTEYLAVSFDGKVVEYPSDMLSQLEPAYAITVHKAQGSEYEAVVLAAFDGAPMLLTRGVLYTGVTRARNLFVGVGDPYVLKQMTENHRQVIRFSGLKSRLLEG